MRDYTIAAFLKTAHKFNCRDTDSSKRSKIISLNTLTLNYIDYTASLSQQVILISFIQSKPQKPLYFYSSPPFFKISKNKRHKLLMTTPQ